MFRPMLAATLVNPSILNYPVYVSAKLDGLRCYIKDGVANSRNGKPFRNRFVQEKLRGLPDGLDGELIVGSPTDGHVLNRTQSGIMSAEGEPDFTYWVFDNFAASGGFADRHFPHEATLNLRVKPVAQWLVSNVEELLTYEQRFLDVGYEGIMVRSPYGRYKYGRSTEGEGLLFKFKRFRDGEAKVYGLLEGMTNANEATQDAFGRTKRSSHQENMIPASRVGTILATDLNSKQALEISPGRMTMDERKHYWLNPGELIGRIVKYKTFDYGTLNVPRFSTFQAFRSPEDMS